MKATCLLRTALFGAAVCGFAKPAAALNWTPTPGAAIKGGHLVVSADVCGATTNEFVGAKAAATSTLQSRFHAKVPKAAGSCALTQP